eukprot:6795674-Prymnesium_polylepis.1
MSRTSSIARQQRENLHGWVQGLEVMDSELHVTPAAGGRMGCRVTRVLLGLYAAPAFEIGNERDDIA